MAIDKVSIASTSGVTSYASGGFKIGFGEFQKVTDVMLTANPASVSAIPNSGINYKIQPLILGNVVNVMVLKAYALSGDSFAEIGAISLSGVTITGIAKGT